MKIIKLFQRGLLLCLSLVLSGCFLHRPAYYPARVSMKDGVPCFSVANHHKEQKSPPKISIISIFSYVGKETAPLWYRAFSPDQPPMRLSPFECLTYGLGEEEVPELQKGFRYGVSILASINDYSMDYQSFFCLHETSDGNTEIHHAKWNNKINGYDWQICE